MNFEMQLQSYRTQVEEYLRTLLDVFSEEPQRTLYDAMNYSLLAGGKRLRPILAMEFARLSGGAAADALPFGTAVEMIHTYSLIHDDLPCMDNDDLRRGRPTNHKVYGEGMAVLAGDALLTDAFYMASRGSLPENQSMAEVIRELAQCAGSSGMVGGQVLDIMSENRQLTEQEVLDIQSRKTGALICAACVLGTMAGGGSRSQIEAARTFAQYLGLAFQIRDDMLDVIGTEEEMGKGVGTDAVKNTFVRLYGLERCEALVEQYTAEAISALDVFEDTKFLQTLAESLTKRRV